MVPMVLIKAYLKKCYFIGTLLVLACLFECQVNQISGIGQ